MNYTVASLTTDWQLLTMTENYDATCKICSQLFFSFVGKYLYP